MVQLLGKQLGRVVGHGLDRLPTVLALATPVEQQDEREARQDDERVMEENAPLHTRLAAAPECLICTEESLVALKNV